MPAKKKLGKRGGLYANFDQQKMAEIWRSKAWKARIAELIKEFPRCEYCNDRSQTANHKRDGYYPGYELCKREEIDIVCNPCNRYWKKHKQRRPYRYGNCTECNAIIFQDRKICYNCGAKVATAKLDVSREKQATFDKIMSKCPMVRVGDSWVGVWLWPGEIMVVSFEEQTDLPWPLVHTDHGEVGLPAFTFGRQISAGSGISWQESLGWSEAVKN